uniref:Uncharacterized protein n=1 Tax=Steinernema glaseri TaxID=37863 RepID=A0A1I8A1Z4_9BILA
MTKRHERTARLEKAVATPTRSFSSNISMLYCFCSRPRRLYTGPVLAVTDRLGVLFRRVVPVGNDRSLALTVIGTADFLASYVPEVSFPIYIVILRSSTPDSLIWPHDRHRSSLADPIAPNQFFAFRLASPVAAVVKKESKLLGVNGMRPKNGFNGLRASQKAETEVWLFAVQNLSSIKALKTLCPKLCETQNSHGKTQKPKFAFVLRYQ